MEIDRVLVFEIHGEMSQQFLQMGDQNTTDLKLHLLNEDGVQYKETYRLYLHSLVLAKSKFYETKIFDRLNSNKKQLPIEMNVRTSHCADNYCKCILPEGYHFIAWTKHWLFFELLMR